MRARPGVLGLISGLMTGLIMGLIPAAAWAQRRAQNQGEPVVIVDLRTGDRDERQASSQELMSALAADGLAPRLLDDDEATLASLTGHAGSGQDSMSPALAQRDEAARAALGLAQAAYGRLDCQAASQAAQTAIDDLSALQAAGAPGARINDALRQAYVYLLLCAHNIGATDEAMLAASRLHRLGSDQATPPPGPPPGVSAAVWQAYPPLDAAANVAMVELAITTDPVGAAVWLDHQPVGQGPVTVLVSEGEHLVAAATGSAATSQRLRVAWSKGSQPLTLTMAVATPAQSGNRASQAGATRGTALGAAMTRLGVRFALVVIDAGDTGKAGGAGAAGASQTGDPAASIEIWALEPGATLAVRVGTGSLDRPSIIATRVVARARAWDGADSNVPLLRESDVPIRRTAAGRADRKQRWWVYATIIGAVATGSMIILVNDLREDRQRIELRWP